MNFRLKTYGILTLLLLALSCEKEPARLDDMYLEFATVVNKDSGIQFRLDNNRFLIPNDSYADNVESGERIIISYTPIKGDTIKVNQVSKIFLGTVEDNQTEEINQNPVKIQSIWVSGGYLNMIFEVEYHSKAHKIRLERNKSISPSDLHLNYSREDDPPGYSKKTYVSFSLSALYKDNPPTKDFTVNINTLDGMRQFNFELSSVLPVESK